MSWLHPPRVKPGPLSRADADALNRALDDLARFVGGFSAAPPLQLSQSKAGVLVSLGNVSADDEVAIIRLTGNPGSECNYQECFVQTLAAAGGSGSGSDCLSPQDTGEADDFLDFNALPGSGSGR